MNNNQVDNPSDDLPTEYWGIVSEIDATIFCIEQAAQKMVKRPPIIQMVDESTGYDKEQHELLQYWSDRLKLLVALLPPDDPHFVRQDEVNGLAYTNLTGSSGDANPPTPPQKELL